MAYAPHGCHRLKPVSKNHRVNSTKLGTKHPWVKGIQGYSNEGPCHFQGNIIRNSENTFI